MRGPSFPTGGSWKPSERGSFLLIGRGNRWRGPRKGDGLPPWDSPIYPAAGTPPLYIRPNMWLPRISDQSVCVLLLPHFPTLTTTVNNTLELPPSPGVPRLQQGAIKRWEEAKWRSFEQHNSCGGGRGRMVITVSGRIRKYKDARCCLLRGRR